MFRKVGYRKWPVKVECLKSDIFEDRFAHADFRNRSWLELGAGDMQAFEYVVFVDGCFHRARVKSYDSRLPMR